MTLPPIEWFGPIPGSNWMPNRDGNPITLIVDHWMAGTLASANARFHNPNDPNGQASAHYGITRDGNIVQWVSDADTAYHAGEWATNVLSIGIEHEASPTMPPTNELYAASAALHAYLSRLHGIRLEVGQTVLPHRAIVPTACPGTLDLDRIVREAGGQMSTPQRIGQSADMTIKSGEVAVLEAIFQYGDRPHTIQRKVWSHKPGRNVVSIFPPVDPDADQTECLDAEPAIFIVDVTPEAA